MSECEEPMLYLLFHGGYAKVVGEDDNWTVAYEMTGETGRLFAAAPKLLTALRSVAEDLHSLDMDTHGWRDMDATAVDQLIAGALRRAEGAIAKATGKESE